MPKQVEIMTAELIGEDCLISPPFDAETGEYCGYTMYAGQRDKPGHVCVEVSVKCFISDEPHEIPPERIAMFLKAAGERIEDELAAVQAGPPDPQAPVVPSPS